MTIDSKVVALICGTVVVCVAILKGYDSSLALVAVIALFGGEKVLRRYLGQKEEKEETEEK